MPAYFKHDSVEWATPVKFFAELDAEFHFTLDVAATPDNAKCERFFTREVDGLAQEWTGTVWCNPPYGRDVQHWIKKAYDSSVLGATVVCLIPSRTDTRWWHEFIEPYAEKRLLKGRLKFNDGQNSAPFPSVVVVFRPPVLAA